MSATPKGGHRGRGVAVRQDADQPSWRERVVARLRSVVHRLSFGLWSHTSEETDNSNEARSREEPNRYADDSVTPPASGSVDSLPDRRRPFTYPARSHPNSNPVELVGTESKETLTITHPHNPDASITSDVWVPVER